jgi:hypothetical protein
MAFSPFGIDSMVGRDPDVFGYDLVSQLAPLILKHQGNGTMSAVLLGPDDPPQKVAVGNYTLYVGSQRARRPPAAGAPPAPSPQPPQQPAQPASVAIFIAAGPDEYFAAGSGVSVTFTPNTPGLPLAGLATVEDGRFVDGRWVPGRRLAGDDDAQGQSITLREMGIQHFTLYRYR